MRDKVVFITGASSGIGREAAYEFAMAGARLAITYNKGKDRGEETRKRCLELGAAGALLIQLDVSSQKGVARAVEEAVGRYKAVDVLVNNAGTGIVKPFMEHAARDIRLMVRVNLEGLMMVTLALLPHLRETVINIGSYLSKNAMEKYAVYCATKYGVRGFTQALAIERPDLRVCCLNPDYTATALTGYGGRPASDVGRLILKAASGEISFESGGDIDVWEVLPRSG